MKLTAFIKMNKQVALVLFLIPLLGFSQKDYKPAVESFESEKGLSAYETKNGNLSLSDAHHKYGKSSLEWQWDGESSIGTSHFKILSLDESPLDYGDFFPASPTLQMALYNETAQDGNITISFEKDGVKEVYFDVPLSFTGWRTIWVPFFEMQGNAPKKLAQVDYDYFRISTTAKSGKLFFDDIIYSQYQDDRHQYPDEIVPFVKADQNLGADHWMPLIANYDRIKNLEPKPISMAVRMDLKKLEKIIDEDLVIDKKYKLYMNSLREDFQKLGIKDDGKTVLGPPLTFKEHQDYYDVNQQGPKVFNDVQSLGKVLKRIASYYDRGTPAEQAEMKSMFLTGTKYFLDQGWQAGSNGGTRHHIGYNVRELAEAFFIKRQLLYDNGLLNEVAGSLHWLFNLGMLLDDPSNFHVNIDYLNTQAYYHLMLSFLFEKQEKQAAMVAAYSNYISTTLAQQNEEWGFKPDGTAWHHNGHYPAYGLGAFNSVPKIINTLAGTRFRIGTEGHENFKKAFMASRIYSQLYDWGFGNAGRHPLEPSNGIGKLGTQFLQMANSGNPEGTSQIDKEVAGAYLRLWGKDDVMNTTLFTGVNGIQKEKLSGYYTFPYGATAVHRRDGWAALIKGYSQYVWASEIYVTANRYGRYPANGTIQLLNSGGEEGSGFKQEGWDWNRYPGATIIYLPLKELETKMPLLMFRSKETFAGATKLDGNGIFGMVLNESKGDNADGAEAKIGFPGKLKAKKSVFSFGGKLIAIGTDISSVDAENPTQTNLFQSFLKDPKQTLYASGNEIKKFPVHTVLESNAKHHNWIVDPYGSGYYILSNDAVQVKKEHQHSYHSKYSLATGQIDKAAKGVKETEADYASAWIDHGMAPDNGSYQYVIYPFLDAKDQKNFGKMAEKDDSYAIKRADEVAHIVQDKPSNTTGYVIFEAHKALDNGILSEVSEPALIMLKENSDHLITISAVQPDLNFPEYKPGKFRNYSRPVELEITLNGKWSPFPEDFVKSTTHADGKTTITLTLVDGLPGEFKLNKL